MPERKRFFHWCLPLDTERFLIQNYQLNNVHIVHWSYFECLIQHICCVKIIISFCSIAQYSTWLHHQKSLVSAWKKLGSMIAQCVPQCSPPGDIISCTTFNISTDAQCANWLFGAETGLVKQNVNCRTQNLPVPTTPKSVSNNPSTLDIPTLPIFRRCRQCIMYGVTTSQKDLQFCSVPPQGWSQSTLALQQCHCYHPCVWVKEFPAQGSS